MKKIILFVILLLVIPNVVYSDAPHRPYSYAHSNRYCPISDKQIMSERGKLENYKKVYFELANPNYPALNGTLMGIGIDKDVIITKEHLPIIEQYIKDGVDWGSREWPESKKKPYRDNYKDITVTGVAR